ncbi:MAG: hypothetical protein DRP65_02940 [Planctomycetota bacterium]|nr:MAG: hypothetical protein DRP65_02940 [Planctomycetota bacterium]
MDETVEGKKVSSHWRQILFWLVVAAMMLLAGVILASWVVGMKLGAEIVKISEAGEPLTFPDVARMQVRQHSDGEDAAHYYVEALASIGPANLSNLKRIHSFYRQNMAALPADQFPVDLRESVSQNLTVAKAVFEKLDKAASEPLARFDIGIRNGIKAAGTHMQGANTIVLLMSLRTMDLILQGRDEDAADSLVSLLKLMRIFDSHPTMVVYTIKAQFVGLACEDVRLLLERGSASAESLTKLEETLSAVVPADALEKVFLAERVNQIEIGRNLIPEKIAAEYLQNPAPDIPERIRLPGSFLGRLRLRQKARRYFRDMDQLITVSRRPWPQPFVEIFDKMFKSTDKPGKLIASAAAHTYLAAEVFVALHCTRIAVAIEGFLAGQGSGQLPEALDELVPNYITSVPLDVFTGKQLLYRHDEESYMVYSTSINRLDDGGSIRPKEGEKVPLDRGLQIRTNLTK